MRNIVRRIAIFITRRCYWTRKIIQAVWRWLIEKIGEDPAKKSGYVAIFLAGASGIFLQWIGENLENSNSGNYVAITKINITYLEIARDMSFIGGTLGFLAHAARRSAIRNKARNKQESIVSEYETSKLISKNKHDMIVDELKNQITNLEKQIRKEP